MLMLSVPATVGLMVLSSPIVPLIYERGQFDAGSGQWSRPVSSSMPSDHRLLRRQDRAANFLCAAGRPTPVVVSLVTITANVLLNISLHTVMGYRGLALGTESPRPSTPAFFFRWRDASVVSRARAC
jgi:putative peptidoglycan lipid II flippase